MFRSHNSDNLKYFVLCPAQPTIFSRRLFIDGTSPPIELLSIASGIVLKTGGIHRDLAIIIS
jgi:hypothetical protein